MADDAEIAIALKYDKEKDSAPRVVAKGLRLKADKIREIAKANNIPVLRNVSLAEALFRVEVGQEIPESLYDAVAEILNFVYALSQQNTSSQRK